MYQRLLELRKARNLTQQRLAIELGIDQTSISSYECGKYLPTVEVLIVALREKRETFANKLRKRKGV